MPNPKESANYRRSTNHHHITARLFSPLRLSAELNHQTQRVIKSNVNEQDYYTNITISDGRLQGGIVVEFLVTAKSPTSSLRVGTVYLSQLCDLLSVLTECPVEFFMNDSDVREVRGREHRQPLKNSRTLTVDEWSWVTGSLVALRRDHPRFLAAASWFRKGLIGEDCLDSFCCFFRVIDRLASTYADKSNWGKDDIGLLKAITQLREDLFAGGEVPALLADNDRIKQAKNLRNDISHGNEPITIDMIEYANKELPAIQDAAFCILDCLRKNRLEFAI